MFFFWKLKAMALLRAWRFLFFTSIALVSGYLVSPVSAIETIIYEKGYAVTTVLDGNKLGVFLYGIYPDEDGTSVYSLDWTKSNIYRAQLPISQSSVIERISGSPQGEVGYRDGGVDEALFDHPKDLTVDDDGTIYVADPRNAAIRKITRAGLVTTIAGGSNRTGHSDGEGSGVTFSPDFDVAYLRSKCVLVIADRGNRMIREIQLPQFIGRCRGATPAAPGSRFTGTASLLAGFLAGVLAGVLVTFFAINSWSQQRHLRSSLCGAGNMQRTNIISEQDNEALINPTSGQGTMDDCLLRQNNANDLIDFSEPSRSEAHATCNEISVLTTGSDTSEASLPNISNYPAAIEKSKAVLPDTSNYRTAIDNSKASLPDDVDNDFKINSLLQRNLAELNPSPSKQDTTGI